MSKYIRYEIKNIQPIRIVNDNLSQSGQGATLRYVPGTAVRGFVINSLKDDEEFEDIKDELFSKKVKFLNAYYIEDDCELIPSPKGFYEDKVKVEGKKEIENVVVNGDFTPGFKRAGLGEFCYFKDQCINYYSIKTGSDLKIKVNTVGKEKRNVFRLEHIKAGYDLVGYIAFDDESIGKKILNQF
nr:hypothetical protein [Lachnospiraceae bacterium]